MGKKGLDTTFVHYGIRKEDMQIIEALCQEAEIDAEWFKEHLLKAYHEKKVQNNVLDDKSIKKILQKALNKI